MNTIKNGNIILAFLLEVFAIFVLGYWGFTLQSSKIVRVIAGLSAPIVMAVIWSIWCAPSSSYRLEGLYLVALKILLFGLVICCLLSMKQVSMAVVFGIAVVINLGLSSYFGTI